MFVKEVKNKKIQQGFQGMYHQFLEDDSILSLEQAAKKVGVDLKKVRKWVISSDGYGDESILQMLGYKCAIRVGKLLKNKDITENEALELLRESGYDERSLEHFSTKR